MQRQPVMIFKPSLTEYFGAIAPSMISVWLEGANALQYHVIQNALQESTASLHWHDNDQTWTFFDLIGLSTAVIGQSSLFFPLWRSHQAFTAALNHQVPGNASSRPVPVPGMSGSQGQIFINFHNQNSMFEALQRIQKKPQSSCLIIRWSSSFAFEAAVSLAWIAGLGCPETFFGLWPNTLRL